MSAGREWERYIWYCAYASAISFNCSAILLDIRVCVWVCVSGRPVATTKCHVSFLFQFAMCEREAAQQQIWFWTQSSLTLSANRYAILYRSVRLSRWVFVGVCVCLCVCSDYRDETTWPAFNSINVPNASLIVGTSVSSPRPRPRPRWQHSARASSTTSFYNLCLCSVRAHQLCDTQQNAIAAVIRIMSLLCRFPPCGLISLFTWSKSIC